METVAELWNTVVAPMKEAEELLRAQRQMLVVADRQAEAFRHVIRNMAVLCDEHKVPALKVAAALAPLFAIGPTPTQEQGPGNTEPLEMDSDVSPLRHTDVAEYQREDRHPTVELPTVAVEDAGDVS
jgi:hypothetical protein